MKTSSPQLFSMSHRCWQKAAMRAAGACLRLSMVVTSRNGSVRAPP
jgi:hypothetical protein